MLKINRSLCALPINPDFAAIIDAELAKADKASPEGCVINFRDPTYSAETGGFHPVEVSINASGVLQYITDFSYFGQLPYVELAKELDFSFELSLFGHMGRDFPLSEGKELFAIFQDNFVSYYQMEVFEVEVSE